MNERIKEMWEEATVSVWPRPGKFTAGEYDHHLAKFAELIVRRCLDILDVEDNGSHRTESVRIAEYCIKKHFGVEE